MAFLLCPPVHGTTTLFRIMSQLFGTIILLAYSDLVHTNRKLDPSHVETVAHSVVECNDYPWFGSNLPAKIRMPGFVEEIYS